MALALLAAPEALAGAGSVMAEGSAGGAQRTWTLLGDVELRRDKTFLTVGYAGARSASDNALTHQVSAGMDHALSEHWLLSGLLNGGLPKATVTALAPARPGLGLPALSTRNSYGSLGLQLSASYDSAGFSDVEYGLDVGLGLTGYRLQRDMFTHEKSGTETENLSHRQEALLVARPSVGGRLLLKDTWELGLRGGFSFYSEDPLSVGQFTEEELVQVARRYVSSSESTVALRNFLKRRAGELAVDLSGRLQGINALAGFPSAPVFFDLKPSVTYHFSPRVRGQLSYAFTSYVPGEGYVQVVGTRWTFRPIKPLRLWGALSLQSDHPQDSAPQRSALVTLGSEYTF